ncbi:MAG: SurA N-terminal domain-containing protein [Gammaproteobacteria bacterium]|nr:SurA N-terminal domain-containing protein [Gammaproteobacteria bacterium]
MLIAIREKTRGVAAALIVGIIIAVFSLWGINSYFEGGSNLLVAKGKGVEVPKQVYLRALDRYKSNVPPSMWDNPFIKQQVVESLINESLLMAEIRSLGYRASDVQLSDYIRSQTYFQTNGQFDPAMYQTALRSASTSVREYESQSRESLALQQLLDTYRQSAIVTDKAVDQALALAQQQRVIDYVLIEPSRFRSGLKITDNEMRAYYEANTSRFQTEEQVQVSYIELSAAALAAGYVPSEEELKEFYNQTSSGAFLKKEKRRISHILIEGDDQKALDEANDLANQLGAGKDFAALARKHSDDPGSAGKGGDLGYLQPGVMVKEFEQAAMSLGKKGELVGPVKTQFGYHLIKLTELQPAVRKPYASMRAELIKTYRQRKGEEQFYGLNETFYNLVFENPDSLEPAAKELGLKLQTSDWFGRSGGKAGITSKRPVVEAAFNPEVLDQGRNSESLEVGDTTLVALRVSGHRPSKAKPYEQVRNDIENILRNQKAASMVVEQRNQLRQAADKQGLGKAAASLGFRLVSAKTLNQEQNTGVDNALVSAAFAADHPVEGRQVLGDVDLGVKGAAVFALVRIVEGKADAASAADRKRMQETLSGRQGDGYFANFQAGLREQADVKIFPENL